MFIDTNTSICSCVLVVVVTTNPRTFDLCLSSLHVSSAFDFATLSSLLNFATMPQINLIALAVFLFVVSAVFLSVPLIPGIPLFETKLINFSNLSVEEKRGVTRIEVNSSFR